MCDNVCFLFCFRMHFLLRTQHIQSSWEILIVALHCLILYHISVTVHYVYMEVIIQFLGSFCILDNIKGHEKSKENRCNLTTHRTLSYMEFPINTLKGCMCMNLFFFTCTRNFIRKRNYTLLQYSLYRIIINGNISNWDCIKQTKFRDYLLQSIFSWIFHSTVKLF